MDALLLHHVDLTACALRASAGHPHHKPAHTQYINLHTLQADIDFAMIEG